MKEEFDLLLEVKKLNYEIMRVTQLFPNKEKVLRDSLIKESFDLIRNLYLTNSYEIDDPNRKKNYNIILSNIYMIDFFLTEAYINKFISEANHKKVNNILREVSTRTKGWINYGLRNE